MYPLCLHAVKLLIQDAQHVVKCLVLSGSEKARGTRDSSSGLPLPANALKSHHPIINPIMWLPSWLLNPAANVPPVQISLKVNDLTPCGHLDDGECKPHLKLWIYGYDCLNRCSTPQRQNNSSTWAIKKKLPRGIRHP